jgi:hypothetical protein
MGSRGIGAVECSCVSSRTAAIVVVSALAIGGVAFAIWPKAAPEAPAAPQPSAPAPQQPQPQPVAADVPKQPEAPPRTAMLKLPDGTEVAPLNGVKNPADMIWGDRPWSPIVRVDHTTIDWYVHADGSLTTTLEVWRQDLGRKDPVTIVARPTDVMPVETADGQIIPLPKRDKVQEPPAAR